MTNAAQAIVGMHITCAKDMFHEKYLVGGHPIAQWAGDLSDDAIIMLRNRVRAIYGFDPGDQHMRAGATQLCLENQYDPLLRFLDSLEWDGVKRLDTWMKDYLKAPDNALNRAISRISLIAAVRRARWPWRWRPAPPSSSRASSARARESGRHSQPPGGWWR
jgi:hypothetical protein